MTAILLLAWSVFSLVLTYLLMPFGIRLMKKRGWTGTDVHKPIKVECAEPGGLIVLLVLALVFSSMSLTNFLSTAEVGAALTVVLTGLVGLLDDLVKLRQRVKVLLLLFTGLPLALCYNGAGNIKLPLIGNVELGGLIYPLFILLVVDASSNLTNMLAGFNGLEAGFASVACGILGAVSLVNGSWSAANLSLVSLGSLLAFLRYNWYPAKVFPGDTGTLMFGSIIASTAILGGGEFLAVSLLMPAILDFVLKLQYRKPFAQRGLYGDTKVDEAGALRPPKYAAFSHAFMRVAPTSERKLVLLILLSEALLGVSAVALMLLLG